jgi:O-antigen ligase
MTPEWPKLRAFARTGAGYCAIAVGFALPVSVALDSIAVALMVLLWLASGPTGQDLTSSRHNRVTVAALALFALCALSLLYGEGSTEYGLMYLKKYMDLLLIPVFVLLFRDAHLRHLGLRAFEAAMLITLVASYLLAMGVLPWTPPFTANPLAGATVFKYQITHGTFMAFAAYLFAERARTNASPVPRALWVIAAGLAVINVLFMVSGRTGYLVLFALALIFCWHVFGWRGFAVVSAGLFVAIALLMSGSNPFSDRVQRGLAEARAWEQGIGADSSIGHRLDFYTTTAAIVRENPLFGVGLGGFPGAYRAQVEGTAITPTYNPHNQFLLFAAQLGIVGLAAYLWLLWALWSCSRLSGGTYEQLVARGLLATAVIGSMVNSFLLDHTEGLFFAWMSGLACAQLGGNRTVSGIISARGNATNPRRR